MPRRRPEPTEWIVVPNWDRFQHYHDRHPPWIKLHLSLLADEEYARLPIRSRLLLVLVWMEYANSAQRVGLSTAWLSARFQMRVTRSDIESLCDAGFLAITASNPASTPLAKRLPRGREREEKIGERASKNGSFDRTKWSTNADLERPDFSFPGGPVLADACPECGVGGGAHTTECARAIF